MRRSLIIRADAGYSLLEILIVLGIFALAAAVVIPRIGNVRSSTTGRITEQTIIDEIRRVRSEAIRSNNMHWLEVSADGRFLETSTDRRINIAHGMRIDPAAVGRKVRFYPDGRSSGADWKLTGGESTVIITVDWLTGHVHIEASATP